MDKMLLENVAAYVVEQTDKG